MTAIKRGADPISKAEYETVLSAIDAEIVRRKHDLREDRGYSYDRADRETWQLLRDYNLIRLLWVSGMRRAECASLKRENIEPERDGKVTIRYTRKRGKAASVVLPKEEHDRLRRLIKLSPGRGTFLFKNKYGQKLSLPGIHRIVTGWLITVLGEGRKLSCHSLRKGAGETLRALGLPLLDIRDFLDHTSAATTEIYLNFRQENKNAATSALITGARL